MSPDMFLTSFVNQIFNPVDGRTNKPQPQSVAYKDIELGLKQGDAETERTWVQKATQIFTERGRTLLNYLNYLNKNKDTIVKHIGDTAVGLAFWGSGCRELNKAFPSSLAKTAGAIFSIVGMGIVTITGLNAAHKHDWRTLLMKAIQLLGQSAAFVLTGDMDNKRDTQVAMTITLLACGGLAVTVAWVPSRFFAKEESVFTKEEPDQNDGKDTQITIPWSQSFTLVETARSQLSEGAIQAFESQFQESLKIVDD